MTGAASSGPLPLVASSLLFLLCAFVLASKLLVLPWVVGSASMSPTLEPGDRLLVDLWSYRQRPPRAGEIVLFRGPEPDAIPMLKRARALPPSAGERPLPRYWPDGDRNRGGGVWLLGDNPAASEDSRRFGAVPRERILGRAILRYWPLSRAGSIR
jgi:signal peptidase I